MYRDDAVHIKINMKKPITDMVQVKWMLEYIRVTLALSAKLFSHYKMSTSNVIS